MHRRVFYFSLESGVVGGWPNTRGDHRWVPQRRMALRRGLPGGCLALARRLPRGDITFLLVLVQSLVQDPLKAILARYSMFEWRHQDMRLAAEEDVCFFLESGVVGGDSPHRWLRGGGLSVVAACEFLL